MKKLVSFFTVLAFLLNVAGPIHAAEKEPSFTDNLKTAYKMSSLTYTALNNPDALPGKVHELWPVPAGRAKKQEAPPAVAEKQEAPSAPAEKTTVSLEICVMGFGVVKTFGEPGVEILFPGKETVYKGAEMARDAAYNAKDAVGNMASRVKNAVTGFFKKEQEPQQEVPSREPAAKEIPAQRTPEQQPAAQIPVASQTAANPAQAGKADALAAKVDKLLGVTNVTQAPQVAGGTLEIGNYINALKNPRQPIEITISQSDEYREELIESGGYWEFSGVIPNWDGGITTVDVPTYEEIVKWQQEQQAMAAAGALIGAAIAAGIAASQQQNNSGGGGGGGSQPQQYQKSQPACGPC